MLRIILLLALCAPAMAEDTGDPLQGFNRKMQAFNDFADRKVLKRVARGYRTGLPGFVRHRIGNAFDNLDDVNNSVNNLLQGKVEDSVNDIVRVMINTTLGLGGMFDVATRMGMNEHEEDWGQTFAVWGIGEGPYVVLPFLGPSTMRHAFARPLDGLSDPLFYLKPNRHRNLLYLLRIIDDRASLLEAEKAIFGDRYIFIRDAYLQRRTYVIKDGQVSDPFADDF